MIDAKLRALGARWINDSMNVWLLLVIVFIVIRAFGVIATSWWIVLVPLWLPLLLFVALPLAFALVRVVLRWLLL